MHSLANEDKLETIVRNHASLVGDKPRNGKAILVQIYPTGTEMGNRHALTAKTLIIGRETNCDIVIPDNSVSRRHASLELIADGGFFVRDLNSTNGTFLNDARVEGARLEDGDYLHIGNRFFRFLMGNNVEALYHEEIYRLTIIDALTEIHNKRYLMEYLDRELARALRHIRPLSIVMFDLDRFKSINDNLGHLAGDFILRELSNKVKVTVRKDELFARYGGEEFTVVLPESGFDAAMAFAERTRKIVYETPFMFDDTLVPVTVSIGVATITGNTHFSVTEIIQHADDELYRAKQSGRNCVCGSLLTRTAHLASNN